MNISKALAITATTALVTAYAAAATAEEVKDAGVSCWAGETVHLLTYSENHAAGISKFTTAVRSDVNADDRAAEHCVSTWSFFDGQFQDTGFCLGADKDGNKWVAKFEGLNGEGTYTIVSSSDGAQGASKYVVENYPQVNQETFSGCSTWDYSGTLPD